MALRTLAQAARGVAASTKEPQAAAAMLDSAQCVMEGSAMLIHEAHQALVHPGDAESQQRLAQVKHDARFGSVQIPNLNPYLHKCCYNAIIYLVMLNDFETVIEEDAIPALNSSNLEKYVPFKMFSS